MKWNSFRQVRFVRTPKNNTSIWYFFRFDDSLYTRITVTEKIPSLKHHHHVTSSRHSMQFAEISSGIFKIANSCNIWREISLKRMDQVKNCKRTIHAANFGSTTWKTKNILEVIGTLTRASFTSKLNCCLLINSIGQVVILICIYSPSDTRRYSIIFYEEAGRGRSRCRRSPILFFTNCFDKNRQTRMQLVWMIRDSKGRIFICLTILQVNFLVEFSTITYLRCIFLGSI